MTKKAGLLTLVLIMALSIVLVGCDSNEGQKEPGEEGLSGNLKLAGSTSVQPLAEELAMRFRELNTDVKIDVAGGGSGAGVESTVNGAADIGMASRAIKDSEMAANPDLQPIVICQDGISVIVNPANEIAELTLEQVKAVFTGEVTNWADLGGIDASITVINREEGSGTRGAFSEIALNEEAFIETAAIQNSTGAVKTAVSADQNAIGYISMGSMSDDVVALKIDGVAATTENAKTGSYPIARPFNFIVNGEAEGLAKAFIDWVLDTEAQGMAVEEGFISVK